MKKMFTNNRGITLIALAITIIVLLILAGITIASLTGDNGLLLRTGSAKENTVKAQAQEELQLGIMDLKIEDAQKHNLSFIDYILNSEEYLQYKLSTTDLHIDKEYKKISYKGNIFSIDDNGQLTLEEKGIILSTNSVEIQMLGETKYEKTIEAILINLEGDIEWKTANESIVKVENGKIIPVEEGETTITAICGNENEYKAGCRVKVEKFIDDSYVQYDVEYDDVYSGKRYTKNTGWRLITQEQNEDGTYNIEFISTGIPCKLCYGWYEVSEAVWKGTNAQRTEFYNKFYNSLANTVTSYAASGLYYNFEKIIFQKQLTSSDRNIGGYNNIIIKNKNMISEEATGEITGKIFIAREDATVRNVTISDIRGYDKIDGAATNVTSYNSGDEKADKKIGLFKLNDYTLDNKSSKAYFTANPTQRTTYYHLLVITNNGSNSSSNGSRITGLRPVIRIENVNMEKDGCIWKIK